MSNAASAGPQWMRNRGPGGEIKHAYIYISTSLKPDGNKFKMVEASEVDWVLCGSVAKSWVLAQPQMSSERNHGNNISISIISMGKNVASVFLKNFTGEH